MAKISSSVHSKAMCSISSSPGITENWDHWEQASLRDTWVHWCRPCAQAQNHKSLLPVDGRRSQAHGTAATTRRKQNPGCSQDHHYLFPELFLASDCPDTYPTLERNTFPLDLNLNISLGCGLNLPLGNNLCQSLSSGFRLFWAKIH